MQDADIIFRFRSSVQSRSNSWQVGVLYCKPLPLADMQVLRPEERMRVLESPRTDTGFPSEPLRNVVIVPMHTAYSV